MPNYNSASYLGLVLLLNASVGSMVYVVANSSDQEKKMFYIVWKEWLSMTVPLTLTHWHKRYV